MKVKGDKVYFEADDYKLAKELLNKHVVIHADGTGPFGEDEGAHVSGMDVDYADNIENYDSLEGKGWDDLDDEEKEWFDGEDDFEQLNPFWADGIVCIDKDLGQSGINWCDWEMIYADLWIEKEDYDKVNKVHVVHYDMEVESTKRKRPGMLLSEAKEILKKNGYYLVEDTDDSEGMSLKDKITMAKRFNNEPEEKPPVRLTLTKFEDGMVAAMKKAGWELVDIVADDEEKRYYFEMEYREQTAECNIAVNEEEKGLFNCNSEWPSGMDGNDEFTDPSGVPDLFDYQIKEWKKRVDYYLDED